MIRQRRRQRFIRRRGGGGIRRARARARREVRGVEEVGEDGGEGLGGIDAGGSALGARESVVEARVPGYYRDEVGETRPDRILGSFRCFSPSLPSRSSRETAPVRPQPQGAREGLVPAGGEAAEGHAAGVDAEGLGVGGEVQQRAHAVLDRGGERVFGREPVRDADHHGGDVVRDRRRPARVVRRPSHREAPAVEIHHDGVSPAAPDLGAVVWRDVEGELEAGGIGAVVVEGGAGEVSEEGGRRGRWLGKGMQPEANPGEASQNAGPENERAS